LRRTGVDIFSDLSKKRHKNRSIKEVARGGKGVKIGGFFFVKNERQVPQSSGGGRKEKPCSKTVYGGDGAKGRFSDALEDRSGRSEGGAEKDRRSKDGKVSIRNKKINSNKWRERPGSIHEKAQKRPRTCDRGRKKDLAQQKQWGGATPPLRKRQ